MNFQFFHNNLLIPLCSSIRMVMTMITVQECLRFMGAHMTKESNLSMEQSVTFRTNKVRRDTSGWFIIDSGLAIFINIWIVNIQKLTKINKLKNWINITSFCFFSIFFQWHSAQFCMVLPHKSIQIKFLTIFFSIFSCEIIESNSRLKNHGLQKQW